MAVTRYKRDRSLRDVLLAAADSVSRKTPGTNRKGKAAEPAKPAQVAAVAPAKGAPAATPPMKIDQGMKMRLKLKIAEARDRRSAIPEALFQTYQPAPGVLPSSKKASLAMDTALQSWAQEGAQSGFAMANPYGAAFIEGVAFLGYSYLAELTQRPEYRRISERIAVEMTRKWIKLVTAGEAISEEEEKEDDDDIGSILRDDKKRDPEADGDKPDADEGRAHDAKTTFALHHDDSEGDEPEPDDDTSGYENDAEGDPEVGAEEDEEPLVDEEQQKRNDELRKKVKEINEDLVKFGVRDKFKWSAEYDGYMGRSHLFIDVERDKDDTDVLKTDIGDGTNENPQTEANFKKGSLRGFKTVEPMWCYPISYNANDPLSDDWYNPQQWYVFSKAVHLSRLLTFVGREVPDILKPAYAFGGLSMSQMAKPYVDNWLRTRQAVTNLIESFSVSGVYTNAQSLLQGGGDEVIDRIELFGLTRSNLGTMVLDKETEEFFNISTPLGTLDHLQAQSQEQMSSVTGIPLIVLLGITPTGLNASSEGELRVFYDLIHAMQEHLFREKLTRVINFIQLNRYGTVDPAISFEFEPLWSLDEKGQAEVDKIKAETHMVYVDGGVVSPDEVRKILIEMPDLPYTGLDPNDVPEPPEPQMPGGGMPGMGKTPMGGGGSTESQTQAADEISGEIEEIAPDVFALDAALPPAERVTIAYDAGEFDESKHKRDAGGKFSSTGGAGGSSSANDPDTEQKFKSKKDHIGHLLTQGTTPKELMQAMGWPSVSMPAQAKSLGMKLEKKDGKYFGVKMSAEELAAAKQADFDKKVEKGAKEATETELAGYEVFLKDMKWLAANGNKQGIKEHIENNPKQWEQFKKIADPAISAKVEAALAKQAPAAPAPAAPKKPEPAKPALPPPTAAELKKAEKATALSLNMVPGEKPTMGEPLQLANTMVKAFNDKYANKTDLSPSQLIEKVQDFKQLQAGMGNLVQMEGAQKAELIAAEKKKAKEKADQEVAEAKLKAEKSAKRNKMFMDELGISEQQAEGVHGLAKMLGVSDKDLSSSFKKYGDQAKAHGYPLSGFEAAVIKNYSNGGYTQVNASLRAGAWTKAQHAYVAIGNAALSKMPAHTGMLNRHTNLSAEDQARYLEGHIVQEPSFTSTSTAHVFGGNTTFVVKAIGKRGHNIKKLSNHPGENEVLFRARTHFHVSKVEGKPGGEMKIHLEEWADD